MIVRIILFCLLVTGIPASAAAGADVGKNLASSDKIQVDGHESEEIWLRTSQGRFRFTAEIADTQEERSRGLMFREHMPPDHGMLFDFKNKQQVRMWMRNTPLPLDMIFLDEYGTVVKIAERTTPFSDAIIDSEVPVNHVLELNAGIAGLVGLKPGDRLEHPIFLNR